ncbi:PAS domain S-box protein [Sphingomonas canadensis]|uniref:histidine kinase n=1 Tax=Sphingomonas canadensis TaxID=1219257 RepID=A0ABW3H352_9SPHN|nr:PAS domain S-box protein [Sphingomonas canadensis]MCW3835789.1 PAS domain S-box protein [Sphingomonas canadensis]
MAEALSSRQGRTGMAGNIARCLVAAIVAAILAYLSAAMQRHESWIVPIWIPNGIVLAVLMLRRGEGKSSLLSAVFAGYLAANLLTGHSLSTGAGMAACNLIEILIASAIIRAGGMGAENEIGTTRGLTRFVIAAGIAAPAAAALLAVAILAAPGRAFAFDGWAAWALTDGLGNLIIAPIVLVTAEALRLRHRLSRQTVLEWVAVMVAGTAVTIAVFAQSQFPLLFLAAPFVLMAAFRLGVSGAAVATLVVTVVASVGTTLGNGPIQLVDGDAEARTFVLQTFVLATFVSALPVAVALRELSRTRVALAEGEQRMQFISNLSPAGIVLTDAAGDMTYASPSWLQLTGMKLNEVLGIGWARMLYGDRAPDALAEWRTLIGQGKPFQREFRFANRLGEAMWVMTYGSPEFDEHGQVTGFMLLILDITDRRRAERRLAEREHDLSLFASNVTDAVFRLDTKGRCLFVTPSVRQVLGYEVEEVLGQPVLQRFHPEDRPRIEEVFRRMAAGELERAVVTYRARHARRDAWIWMEANCQAVRDDAGTPREIVASLRDVTRRKEMEEELETERQRAENATQAKSRFLASMSHEIRTPMNGVLGFADLLLAGDLDPVQQERARIIAESGRMMMRILNEILDHSKIEAGQMSVADETVDLTHAIRRSVRLFESAARQKGIALDLELDASLPRWVRSDGLRLRQIVTNLVGNAVKFTQDGGVRVAARAEGIEGARLLVLEVHDSGVGIPADRLEAIFGEFVQADTGSARAQGGTGLGLAISRSLARLMGGSINVTSELGKGSCFILTLPLAETDAPADSQNVLDEGQPEGTLPARVLAAEDNEINQQLIAAVLKQLGIACEIAPDGRRAVAAVLAAEAQGRGYDLVLMDLQMPEMDGFEAVRLIRDAGIGGEQLPVVALTANAYQEDVQAALGAGMQDHLAKPIDAAMLVRVLRRWASIAPAAPAPSANPALAELRPQFRQRLEELRAATIAFGEDGGADARADFFSRCHQMAGNAALFGYAALGSIARVVERLLGEEDDPATAPAIALLLRHLGEAIASEDGEGAKPRRGRKRKGADGKDQAPA